MSALFSFDGRITRKEFSLTLFVGVVLLTIAGAALPDRSVSFLAAALLAPVDYVCIAQGSKRCHDLNRSGWYLLIPGYILFMLFASGDPSPNRFGARRGIVGEKALSKIPPVGVLPRVALAVLLIIPPLIRIYVVEPFHIPTESMAATLLPGDFIMVSKIASTPVHTARPERGEIVAFRSVVDTNEPVHPGHIIYVKRCLAIAGDTVDLHGGHIYVNAREVALREGMHWADSAVQFRNSVFTNVLSTYGPVRIPKRGDVVRIGSDNIEHWSKFIRREGHSVTSDVHMVFIDGTPSTSYTVERDYCFILGDNLSNSIDSRIWGFLPTENIVGKPLFVYWSWDPIQSSIRWNRIFKSIN